MMATAAPPSPVAVSAASTSSQPPPQPYQSCTVLWSTQSGRAKACARRTARLLRTQGVAVHGSGGSSSSSASKSDGAAPAATGGYGCAFDAYGASNFLEIGTSAAATTSGSGDGGSAAGASSSSAAPASARLIVLFVSTTGDAEQCDSIRETWAALLRKSLPPNLFANVRFALFSLGDRAYGPTAFCAAGRKLAARLVQLGARPFCPVGYGDDGTPNGGVFADLDAWLEAELLPKISPGGVVVDDSVRMVDVSYRVEGMKGGTGAGDKETTEEWQLERYRPFYDEFFATQCPATAYRYSDQTGMRRLAVDASGPAADPPLVGRVVTNDRITSDDWMQDTRNIRIHVDMPIDGTHSSRQTYSSTGGTTSTVDRGHLPYMAGDVATILPSNSVESVDKFLAVVPRTIRSMADDPIQITHLPGRPTAWPRQCTLRGLLTYCADINSLPEREDLRALAPYCSLDHPAGSDHRDKLVSLSETKDAALYGDYVLREKRSWADVLYDFDSVQFEGPGGEEPALTVEHLLTILTPIMPRHFSIASSPSRSLLLAGGSDAEGKKSGFDVELCVAVVKGVTPHGRSYTGLCSGYLSRLASNITSGLDPEENDHRHPVRIWIRPGSFDRLPLSPNSSIAGVSESYFETPIMCIGAGTGIAPLRSLILEREAVQSLNAHQDALLRNGGGGVESSNGATDSVSVDNILVFGCRKQASDFYYKEEWRDLIFKRHLRLITAFSRDHYHKMYVQRVAREADDGLLIPRHILENGGAVYIAGGAKMAHAVKDELVECLGKFLPGGERDAKIVLRKLAKAGRFSVEAWS